MILIADSSAVITLAIVDKLDILQTIFKEVYIPNAVYQEITKTNKKESIKLKDFFQNRVKNIKTKIDFNISLGRGESEAIFLDKDTKNLILKYAKED